MIILDTNVLSEIAKPDMDVRVRTWFGSQSIQSLFTTAVTLAEVTFGVEIMPDGLRKTLLKARTEEIFVAYFRLASCRLTKPQPASTAALSQPPA